ncbi:MAG: hypothetical protein CO093_11170, partial [Alphaproteobacteria bacterium CG_4_9_14_3_um_filter_47_13]
KAAIGDFCRASYNYKFIYICVLIPIRFHRVNTNWRFATANPRASAKPAWRVNARFAFFEGKSV